MTILPLPERPQLPTSLAAAILAADFERFREGLPPDPRAHIAETYGLDITGEYGGRRLRNPFGKASGQLSLNARQVQRDHQAGLGFVVLKTVIAQDASGGQSMHEWAIPETHMRVERIVAPDGTPGWTVTWKGRGWYDTFDAYCALLGEALAIGGEAMPVAASVKYHLPAPGEKEFREEEYRYTTARLMEVWVRHVPGPLILEKDFSPTLAGDDRSREQAQIVYWLSRVPDLIRASAPAGSPGIALGIKLMNARFDDDFQAEMVRAVVDEPRTPPDFLICWNRLFDPHREFEGKRGVAYGGPELSQRNLRCLRRVRCWRRAGRIERPLPPISGTGDIVSGKRAVEYALLGATSCQMHTLFQLPDTEFAAITRDKSVAVLHHLLFHPESGLVAWLLHLREQLGRRELAWLELPALDADREEATAP